MDVLSATLVGGGTRAAHFPAPTVAEIAFAGRSNVGKSSLINRLAQRKKLVRTSNTPGATRTIQVFRIKTRSAEIDFVDLPGYGYAARSKAERRSWGPMIEGFLRERAGLRGVVVLVDLRRGLEEDDRELLAYLDSLGLASVVVATKMDKLGSNERRAKLAALQKEADRTVIGTSSETGDGRTELFEALLGLASIAPTAG